MYIGNRNKIIVDTKRFEYSLNYALTKIKTSPIKPYINDIYLYGSYARKQHRYNSDVDLLVELNENININEFREEIFKLKGIVSPPDMDYPEVDLKIVIGNEWKTNKMLYYQNVKKEGIKIWE